MRTFTYIVGGDQARVFPRRHVYLLQAHFCSSSSSIRIHSHSAPTARRKLRVDAGTFLFHRYKGDSVLAVRYQPGKLQPMRSMVSDTLINDVGRIDEAFLNIFICAALHWNADEKYLFPKRKYSLNFLFDGFGTIDSPTKSIERNDEIVFWVCVCVCVRCERLRRKLMRLCNCGKSLEWSDSNHWSTENYPLPSQCPISQGKFSSLSCFSLYTCASTLLSTTHTVPCSANQCRWWLKCRTWVLRFAFHWKLK